MHNVFNVPLSRRQFLRASALAAATTALPGVPGGKVLAAMAATEAVKAQEDHWIPTTCLGCAPHVKCSHFVHRVNGVALRLRGNPAAPFNQGKNCARANSMISQLYNPYRVKFPVKRTNPRKGPGVDPKWVEISWDEAFDTVAKKLRELRADNPGKLVMMPGHLGPNLLRPFADVYGTPNVTFGGTAVFCGGGSSTIASYLLGEGHGYPDMPYAKFVISFGAQSIQGAKGTPKQLADYLRGKDQGLRIVNVAPMVTASTAKSDEWVPIKPGTTLPFCMSMAYVLVHELRTYDAAFLKTKTNAPYLIGSDGKYVRDVTATADDTARGAKLGKPLVWDVATGEAKPFDDPTIGEVALEGSFTVGGVAARPVFEILKDHLRSYTPDAASAITDIPATTIRRLAKEWADNACIGKTIAIDGVTLPYRPVAAVAEGGAKGHIDNDQIVFAAYLLGELVGAIGVPGAMISPAPPALRTNPADGLVASAFSYKPIEFPLRGIGRGGLYPTAEWPGMWTFLTMSDPQRYAPPYTPEVLGFQGGNPQQLAADPEVFDAAFRNFKFIFAVSLVFDDPTEQADIVFPESSWLERYAFQAVTPHGSLSELDRKAGIGTSIYQPVVDNVFDTRSGDDIWLELARKIGIAEGPNGLYARINRNYGLRNENALPESGSISWADIVDRALKSKHGADRGLDWFKSTGLLVDKPVTAGQFYAAAKFPKARYPIYFEEFVGWRERLAKDIQDKNLQFKPSNEFVLESFRPLPSWRPHPEHTAPAKFPFYAINFKLMELHYGNIDQPWLNELARTMDPYATAILVNPKAAAKLGLKDGNEVVIESFTGGKTQGQVKLTNLVRPDVVAIGGAWGVRSAHIHPWARKGPHFNSLLKLSEEFLDPVRGGVDLTTRVRLIST